jgi:general secretion pathway protein G
MKPLQRRRGLTLVELLAVLVVVSLLAGALTTGFVGLFEHGKHELAKTGVSLAASRVQAYRVATGRWPDPSQGLAALSDGSAVPADPYYLNADQLIDPWGAAYVLEVPGPNGHPFQVVSYGADGVPGGERENADISSIAQREQTP